MSRARVERALARAIGLDPDSIGAAALDLAIKTRMQATRRRDLDAYAEILEHSREELDRLIQGVVVSETWFFRHPEAFTFLGGHAAAISRSGASVARRVRIASIPCATGEEPYSVVMALLDAGLPAERIEVVAIDISPRAIELARAGRFGARSFRGEDLRFRARYFAQHGDRFEIDRRIHSRVDFRVANALDPDFDLGARRYDAILCRNLLIYLDAPSRALLLDRLERALTETGVLLCGHAEAIEAVDPRFQRSPDLAAFAYLRAAPCVARAPAPPRPRGVAQPRRSAPHAPAPVPRVVEAPREAALRSAPTASREDLEQQISAGRADAETYCQLGATLRADGLLDEATGCFERALYLDRHHYYALIHLALLSEQRGDGAAAARLRQRAARAGAKAESA